MKLKFWFSGEGGRSKLFEKRSDLGVTDAVYGKGCSLRKADQ